jgi:two-component system, chemotaxis family, CheB/CheR fusion protein
MADDRQEQAIVVILSGMGTDGTLGLKAIKEKGGAVFVQEPDQAKFNGMPKSAITPAWPMWWPRRRNCR